MSYLKLIRYVCVLALLISGTTNARDISNCYLVADGRAEVVSLDAHMANGTAVEIDAILARPSGNGPHPAIVISPGGRGPFLPYCYGAVMEQFVEWGYVVLMAYGTTARDAAGNTVFDYTFEDRASYASGAAYALSEMSAVDSTRIGLWGHSNGGWAVFEAMLGTTLKPVPFRVAVAAAPYVCPSQPVPPPIPLLIIIGDQDKESAVNWCIDYSKKLVGAPELEFLLLTGAGHAYWYPETAGDAETAARQAKTRLKTFLARHLRDAP